MAKSRQKRAIPGSGHKVWPNQSIQPLSAPVVPPRLDPETALVPPSDALTPAPAPLEDPKKHYWYLPPDSKVRKCALLIMAMRMNGLEDAEIAKQLGISPKSIGPYIYRAGKNGWITFDTPRDRVDNSLMGKALDNFDAMLDNDDPIASKKIKHEATMELLKGTLFRPTQETAPVTQQTVVSVRVVMPDGPRQQMREDTGGGIPAHIDAEIEP